MNKKTQINPDKNKSRRSTGDEIKPGGTKSGKRMLILMLVLAATIPVWFVVIYPFVMVRTTASATIRIPRGATPQNVSDSLTKYFGAGYAKKVMMAARLRNTDFSRRFGAYRIDRGTNAFSAMRRLTSGGQTPVRVTINKYRSLPLLTDYISSYFNFPADSLAALFKDPAVMAEYGLTPENAMALVFNDTYEFYWTASPREVIRKIGDNYKYYWNEDRRRHAEELEVTPAELTTLASIVDEETNIDTEKGTIGQLYLNRLRIGMPLQADPTIRFALGDFMIRRVLREHLKVESPYNTYIHRGLPPGPICTTDKRTISQILNADPTPYLYMCADASFSGEHKFAETYAEHMQNAMRYQHALDNRNIK